MRRNSRERTKTLRRATNEDLLGILRGEKLAKFLYENTDAYCINKPECALKLDSEQEIAEEECKKCMLEWLRKEAKLDGDNDGS